MKTLVMSYLTAAAIGTAGASRGAFAQVPAPPRVDTATHRMVMSQGDSVKVELRDVDLRAAIEALSPYVDRPVVFGSVTAGHVTLETSRPIPRANVLRVLRGLVESQGYEVASDSASGTYVVRPHVAAPALTVQAAPRVPADSSTQQLYVIRLRHARAVTVAATVNALYGRASSLGESAMGADASGAGPTLSEQLNPSPTAAGVGGHVGGMGSTALSAETTIVPDPSTNSLLIRGTANDYALIKSAVDDLDIRPLQVLIEVLIAEVRSNSRFAMGIGASVSPTKVGSHSSLGGATVSGVSGGGPVPDSTLGDFVLGVLKGGRGVNFRATLTAAESRGDAKIISRPVLIAANNQTANILVGSQQPFVQLERSLPTSTDVRDQVVQYRDVGTRLTVRPTISSDGYVVLAVTQEVNQVTNEVQFNAPVISTRTVQTQLLVRDSQTVVLGGLSDQQRDGTREGVPLLSRIPLVGRLFGNTEHDAADTEFFLFITPRIIRTDADADSVTARLRQRTRPEKER